MNAENAPAARHILLSALLAAIAADLLLRWIPWGAGAALWTLFMLGTAAFLFRHIRPQRTRDLVLPFAGAILAASGIVWRDSPTLTGLNVLLLFASLATLTLGPQGIAAWNTGVSRVIVGMLKTLEQSIAGFFRLLFDELDWRNLFGATGRMGPVIRGLIIAFPALIVFGSLLASADVAFAKLLKDFLVLDPAEIVEHLFFIAFVTAVCIGFFYALARGERGEAWQRPSFFRLGATDVAIALLLIDVLFAAFVAVQFRYFFGGADLVRVTPGLTYTEYARSGFFELVSVVGLVLPMLLFAEWIIDKEKPGAVRLVRGAALVQVALVLVIAASAWQRMALYRTEFGLTELRLYTSVFIIWLAVLLIWLALTALTGRRERFFIGAAVTGLIALFVLHAMNPDATVAAHNMAQAKRGIGNVRGFDAEYAMTLSDDAVPAMIRLVEQLPCSARRLLDRDAGRPSKWRTWNWSRSRAHSEIDAHRAALEKAAAQCPRSTSRRPPHRH